MTRHHTGYLRCVWYEYCRYGHWIEDWPEEAVVALLRYHHLTFHK